MAIPSAVYPPEIWARESLLLLSTNNVVANLVHRNFSSEIAQQGDTINTRKPQLFSTTSLAADTATDAAAMTFGAAAAETVSIALDKHETVAFRITQRDQDTSVKNLIEEFMEPAVIPLAEKIDSDLLSTSTASATWDDAGLMSWGTSASSPAANVPVADVAGPTSITEANLAGIVKVLIDNKIPINATGGGNVSWVVNSSHYQGLLANSSLLTANTAGVNPPPLKTGWVGQVMGMNLYVDQNLPLLDYIVDGATTVDDVASVVFHKNALTFVTRPLETVGEAFGVRSATVERDGIGLRVMMSYDHATMAWLVSLDILYGYKMLDQKLRCIVTDAVA